MGTVVSIISSEALQLNFLVCDSHDYLTGRMHIKLLFVFAAFALSATDAAPGSAPGGCADAKINCSKLENCIKDGFITDGCHEKDADGNPKKVGAADWINKCCEKCLTSTNRENEKIVDQEDYLFNIKTNFAKKTFKEKCFPKQT